MGKKIPAYWFDDPEWEVLRRRTNNEPIPKALRQRATSKPRRPTLPSAEPRAQLGKEVTEKEVVVNLKFKLPKLRLAFLKQRYRLHKKTILVGLGAFASVLIVFGIFKTMSARQTGSKEVRQLSAEEQAQTTFNPLVPLENLTDESGKQATPEYRYDQAKKVLGYTTQYNNAVLTISQQQLPETFKSSPGELARVAKNIQANTSVETQKGLVYVATDEASQAQTAVFTTDDVLIFVRSDKKLDETEWKFYVNQLQPRQYP